MTNLNNSLHISKDVFSSIVEIAINEVEGAHVQESSFTDKIKKHPAVNVTIENDSLIIDASICIDYGMEIPAIAPKVQNSIINAIEDMTSTTVKSVNIHIDGLKYPLN